MNIKSTGIFNCKIEEIKEITNYLVESETDERISYYFHVYFYNEIYMENFFDFSKKLFSTILEMKFSMLRV